MKIMRRLLVLLLLIATTFACSSGSDQPTPFPTAGITVQAFPYVEIKTPIFTPAAIATDTTTFTPTPLPPSETFTPWPSDTPTLEPTPAGLGQAATALIQVKSPTATRQVIVPTQAPVVKTAPPTNTQAPAAGPIAFRAVQFVTAKPDASRDNGSFTTLSVEFAGSRAPFTLKHDNLVGSTNPNGDGKFENAGVNYTFIYFTILKTCGGPIVGTLTITGGDGQTFTRDYYVDKAPCS